MTSSSPARTGFTSETTALFALRTTVGCSALRNTLGAVGRIVKLRLLLTPPAVRRVICELPSILKGSCAVICASETNTSGIAVPFTDRQDSPRAVGIGTWLVATFVGLIAEPVTLIKPPGATGLV